MFIAVMARASPLILVDDPKLFPLSTGTDHRGAGTGGLFDLAIRFEVGRLL